MVTLFQPSIRSIASCTDWEPRHRQSELKCLRMKAILFCRKVFAPHAVVAFVEGYAVVVDSGRSDALSVQTLVSVRTIEFELERLSHH